MSIPEHFITDAKNKITQINSWFQEQVQLNPSAVMSLVAERTSKIEKEIYANFRNERSIELEALEDDNTLHLRCRAGRAHPFGRIPRDSKVGTVESDNSDWINVPEKNRVHEMNNLAGGYSVNVSDDRRKVTFEVHCTGVDATDTTRNHGAFEGELHAIFKMTTEAINEKLNLEILELGNIIGS